MVLMTTTNIAVYPSSFTVLFHTVDRGLAQYNTLIWLCKRTKWVTGASFGSLWLVRL